MNPEYIQNLCKLQEQLDALRVQFETECLPLTEIAKKYLKLSNIPFDSIDKIDFDTGEINPSNAFVTITSCGWRGERDSTDTISIPIKFFTTDNALAEFQKELEEKAKAEWSLRKSQQIKTLKEQAEKYAALLAKAQEEA